jgi:guanosine-3',5'-bis(diphosphate) 3'-pyrophosphohydrolase
VIHFAELRRELETYLDEAAVEQIHEAYRFAAHAHKGQQRQSGDPYISHPLAVAQILAELQMDRPTILAAILHDVIEDTSTDKMALAQAFGADVAELVDGVSKLEQIQFQSRAEAQAESFRKMLLAMAKDLRVILIKLADRLHNMRTLGVLPPEKRRRIAHETLDIYVPIAQRLGMHAFRIELEDLGFAALHPFRYRILQEAVRKARRSRKKVMSHIETQLKECLEKCNLPPSVVWARQKHLYRIYKDMQEKHLSFAEIMDAYTFCIVVDTVDTCYRVLGAVHNLFKPLPERFRDYIALPKANGYQSLHTTLFGPYGLPLEIHIRTADMDNMADSGIATQGLFAATEGGVHPAQARASEWLKRLLDIQQTTGNALEFIEDVKIDLFPEEVYVFTPKGDIMELPRGATAVDLAYAIHSDIGNSCVAAKIERRLAPLSAVLVNGQTVEIVTSSAAQPNPAWLNFVVTGKARSNIRQFLKNQHRTESVAFGQHLLDIALTALGTAWEKLATENIAIMLDEFHYKTREDLFEAIGLGHHMAPLLAQRLLQSSTTKVATGQPLVIRGTEGMLVKFAECCRPIPGDPVVGVLCVGQGIMIHMAQCEQVAAFSLQSEKYLAVCWEENMQGMFKVDIKVVVSNQRGVLAQLAAAIAKANANIDNIKVEEGDAEFCVVYLTIAVQDRLHLARVMRRLRIIKAVVKLTRSK